MPHDGSVPLSTHRQVQRVHAMRRYRDRYHVDMQPELYDVLCMRLFRWLTRGEGFGIERCGEEWCTYFIVCGNGDLIIAVWDEQTMQICTFLPRTELIP